MKTALRLAVCAIVAVAAGRAVASSPMSNQCGDGDANVPFVAQEDVIPAEEAGGGGFEPIRALTPAEERGRAGDFPGYEQPAWEQVPESEYGAGD